MANQEFDFPLYAAVWYEKNGWEIPDVHLEIFDYLENEENWGSIKTKILLLWRGIGKSTIIDLWIAYKLTKNPKLRFLLVSANHATAKRSTNDILHILRLHPFSVGMIVENKYLEVRKDRFFVKGYADSRNASVETKGITSTITGLRADYIIFDDIEVPKNSGNALKREILRKQVDEANHLLVPEIGRRIFIGTYHDSESVYDETYAKGATRLKVPILSNIEGEFPYQTGESRWEERFDEDWISQKQLTCKSKAEWLSQYLLIPATLSDAILDVSKIRAYEGEVKFVQANKSYLATLNDKELRSVSCWWDPAMSSARGDDSVVAIVFSDDDNNYFVHRTIAVKGDTDQQCIAVKKLALEFNIPVVTIEMNGIGALLPPMLIKHLEGTGIAVDTAFSSEKKNDRIIKAYEVPLYAGRIHAHASVLNSPFLHQLKDFEPSQTNNKDDYIDSVASAILREPIRLAAAFNNFGSINKRWMSMGTFDIKIDEFSF